MKPILSLGLLLLLTLPGVGCSRSQDSEGNPLGPTITDSTIAGQYALADVGCQDSEADLTLDNTSTWQFDGTKSHEAGGFTAKSSNDTGLSGDAISSSYFGLHVRQTCTKSDGGLDCKAGKLISAPKVLKVCQSNQHFSQTSYEGIGLTSLAHIEAAAKFYRTLEGSLSTLVRANLFVIPIVEKVVTNSANGRTGSFFESDNLAYLAEYVGAPAFLIFPKGATSSELGIWKNLNLWEAPWTLAHEFGHHVLRTHTRVTSFSGLTAGRPQIASTASEGLIQLPDRQRGRDDMELQVERTAGGERVVDRDLIWDGMNEGFSDLFAFYSRGAQPGQSSGIDCFAHNRDVEEAAFADARPKKLDQGMLAAFMSTSKVSASRDCNVPNFQDIHILGAVIAHGVNELFADVAKRSPNGDGAAIKGVLLLKWASRLETVAKRSSFAVNDLLLPALEVAAEGGLKLSAAQCGTVRTIFPVFADRWLGAGGNLTCL